MTGSEWMISVGMSSGFALRQKAIRIKALRLLPEGGMPVRGVRKHQHERSSRHAYAVHRVLDGRVARVRRGWRVQAQHLFDDLQRVRQPLEVVESRRFVAR